VAKLHPLLKTKRDALGDVHHKELTDRAKRMNVPFWWHGATLDDSEIYHNGTLSLVDTGEKTIGITAWHVWNGLRRSAVTAAARSHNGSGSRAAAIHVHASSPTRVRSLRVVLVSQGGSPIAPNQAGLALWSPRIRLLRTPFGKLTN